MLFSGDTLFHGGHGATGRSYSDFGITGYPESHPTIHDDLTIQAMWDKRHHATA